MAVSIRNMEKEQPSNCNLCTFAYLESKAISNPEV